MAGGGEKAESIWGERYFGRREFLQRSGAASLAAACGVGLSPAVRGEAATAASSASAPTSESLVKLLYDTLSPKQRETVCFPWDHRDKEKGLLRARVEANWMITDELINGDFYTADQRELIAAIFKGMIAPEWHERYLQEQDDDCGGFGENNALAIFGEPGGEKCQFVLTGRHMTLRCDGNSAEHVAFGGPIFYGHDPSGTLNEEADHAGNVFWDQAVEANKLYQMLDGKQRKLALVSQLPAENAVGFRGKQGEFAGIPIVELSADQRGRMQEVLRKLVEPFRQSDRDEAIKCLSTQGGLDACRLAFFSQGDIGADGVWDNWRLEGPSFVWHWRGAPHVHVWVNVADDPSVKLNA